MATKYVFGEIKGYKEGAAFESRQSMHDAGIHSPTMAGIEGSKNFGACSIVLSGGYEDDEDHGDLIIYTGHGGVDRNSGNQIADQSWDAPGNAGLIYSCNNGLPVRVTRGAKHKSIYAPTEGYVYGGLYNVESYWQEKGKSGFNICRFRLIKETATVKAPEVLDHDPKTPARKDVTISRLIRDTAVTREVKAIYKDCCQVCGVATPTMKGSYSEGAHIRPVGKPHNGPDTLENMLCLCPNHHASFDKGGFAINDDLTLTGSETGGLYVHKTHFIRPEYLAYHRYCFGYS